MDRGFFLTLQAMRRQLSPMPCDYYQIRLIHGCTRTSLPGDRVWSAVQLTRAGMVGFLRLRNREGYDIFFHPFAGPRNAGYILLDLDRAADQIIEAMRANGHEPCVVLRTSPGHLQAWIRVSLTPLDPAIATSVAAYLATLYGADRASADWRHCGRLAGFTNQKPTRRQPGGFAPWATLLFAQPRLATQAAHLLEANPDDIQFERGRFFVRGAPDTFKTIQDVAFAAYTNLPEGMEATPQHFPNRPSPLPTAMPGSLTPAGARRVYSRWLHRLQIPQRFSPPDWSIADLWIAARLLRCRIPAEQIQAVLRLGSPAFPRAHSDPEDYLRRTLARAAQQPAPFPARLSAVRPRP